MKIAFLGTGLMGAPMARHLLAADHELHVYNRTPEKARTLANEGAALARTPAEAIEPSELVLIMVTDAVAVGDVLHEGGKLLPLKGKTVVQMSTIAPDESRGLAREIADAGGDFLEMPVLGSTPQAMAAELLLMAGGNAKVLERIKPVLSLMGHEPVLVGPVGAATTLKLALNHLIAAEAAAFSLSLGMVRQADIDPELFMGVLRNSPLFAPTFDKKLSSMLDGDFEVAHFPTKHMRKDVRLVSRVAESMGLSTVGLEALKKILDTAMERGLAEADYASLYDVVDPLSNARD